MRGFTVGIEDFRIELACGMYAASVMVSVWFSAYGRGRAILRDIAVDDLSHPNMATIRHQIESLCLHTGRGHCSPL